MACLVLAVADLAGGNPPSPGLLALTAIGPLIGWYYRRWTGASLAHLATTHALGFGVLVMIGAAALTRRRGRVVWRGREPPLQNARTTR